MRGVYRPGTSKDPATFTGGTDGTALPGQNDRSVGALALFFDLVFVYAMSHVTNLMLGVSRRSGSAGPTLLTGPAFVVVTAFVDSPYRELLWLVGGLIDFGGPIICGMDGWRVLPS